MADLTYLSCPEDVVRGAIDFDTDSFKRMLVTNLYTPDQDVHNRRDDVTNEVAAGGGYTTGGQSVTPTISVDAANNRIRVTFPAGSWGASTITARGEVIYKDRGGAAAADELVAYNDFGADISSSGGAFNVAASTLDFNITT